MSDQMTIYSTQWCGYCHRLMKQLDREGVAYDVVDIELRVSMGYLLGNNVDAPSRNVPFHDAVLQCDNQFDNAFPYLKTPLPGAKGDGS